MRVPGGELPRDPLASDGRASAEDRARAAVPAPGRRALVGAALAALLPGVIAGLPEARAAAADDAPASRAPSGKLLFGKPLPLPAVGRWQFGVYYGDYQNKLRLATLEYAVEVDGSRYRLQTEGRASGVVALVYSGVLTQSSAGRLSENGLAPEKYSEQRGNRPRRSLSVDYASNQVSFEGKPPETLVPGAQDRLSALIQLGLMARALPERFAKGSVIALPELTLGDIEKSRYLSMGESVLEAGSGPLRALHLERTAPRGEGDPKIEIWLGYDQSLLPVRIRATEPGGRVLDQMVLR